MSFQNLQDIVHEKKSRTFKERGEDVVFEKKLDAGFKRDLGYGRDGEGFGCGLGVKKNKS